MWLVYKADRMHTSCMDDPSTNHFEDMERDRLEAAQPSQDGNSEDRILTTSIVVPSISRHL